VVAAVGGQPGTDVGGGFNCYVPGRAADDYRPFGAGKLIPAGSDLSVQVHYTPIGKEVVDRPLIGFTVADAPPGQTMDVLRHRRRRTRLRDSPNEANYKARRSISHSPRTWSWSNSCRTCTCAARA
jgi:hypothetical protein